MIHAHILVAETLTAEQFLVQLRISAVAITTFCTREGQTTSARDFEKTVVKSTLRIVSPV